MSMTKKDYEAVAGSIRYSWRIISDGTEDRGNNAYADGSRSILNVTVQRLVDSFKALNPWFDEDIFRRTCGQTFDADRYPQGTDKKWFFKYGSNSDKYYKA